MEVMSRAQRTRRLQADSFGTEAFEPALLRMNEKTAGEAKQGFFGARASAEGTLKWSTPASTVNTRLG
jgi:hypothetical protein